MKVRFAVTAVVGAVLAMGAIGSAKAQVLTLAELIRTNGTIQNGDKLFSDFAYLATGDMPGAGGINVKPITIAGNLGLQFQGAFIDLPGGGGSDALITYMVTVTDPNFKISDAHIDGNPDVVGGTGALTVTDSFTPDAPNTMSIFDIEPGATQVSDFTIFATPLTTLHVQKDILGIAGTGIATLSFVNQTYSQTAVPEPSTFAFAATSGIGMFVVLRRRKKA